MDEMKEIAAGLVAEHHTALTDRELPGTVGEAYTSFVNAINEVHAAGDQLKADLAELNAKRDLIPPAGHRRLLGEARAEAGERGAKATRAAQEALDGLEMALRDAALPVLAGDREQLARQELAVAIGNASGPALATRVSNLAQHGSREAIAALFTPFGRTLLASRGLAGRDLEQALDHAKTLAAMGAAEHGTDRERKAAAAMDQVGRLGGAIGASGTYLQSVIKRAG